MLPNPDLPIEKPQKHTQLHRRDIIREERAAPRTAVASTDHALSRRRARTIPGPVRGTAAAVAVALLAFPSLVPPQAYVPDPVTARTVEIQPLNTQTMSVQATQSAAINRDGYTVTAKPQPIAVAAAPNPASEVGYSSTAATFVNDPASAVQWPFTQGVPISSGFGPRNVPGCGFCSTNHKGLDLNPGSGTPIQAIADGVVVDLGNPSGPYGVFVVIEHVVDGQKVNSMYAHMLLGSLTLSIGQTVTVGQSIGAVGSTGNSTGAHLHFEILLGGTLPVDPFAWLTTQVGS
ncbi:M23 family metallopeptidase [Marisediminicola senii]|uniref:M23 family metallopeptidase n=1 Tax=Marisediminicola senii TaxID=2711233 RepID=UPI0013EC7D1D|nr:M23 family metallopeptidase [Marisediminicola senii]